MNKLLIGAATPLLGFAAAAVLAGCGGGSGGSISALPNEKLAPQVSVPNEATITFVTSIHSEAPGDRTITMMMRDASGNVLISATCVKITGNSVGGGDEINILAHRLCTAGPGGLYASGTVRADEATTAKATSSPFTYTGDGTIIGQTGELAKIQGQFNVTGTANAFFIPFPWTLNETWTGRYNFPSST